MINGMNVLKEFHEVLRCAKFENGNCE